ncbi:MAG: DUF3429 family protein [Halioglobus sp.]
MTGVPATARLLGTAGLLPFIAGAAIAVVAQGEVAAFAHQALAAYALAIICFLCGAWWGIALIRRDAAILLVSNLLVVLAWLAVLLLAKDVVLVGLALLLVTTVVVEGRYALFEPQPAYYRRMRWQLTAVATTCLFTAALFA